MLVIIPHSTEILKLTKLQKELIKNSFTEKTLITRNIPLWIELPFITEEIKDTKDLKKAAGGISSVIIEKPEYRTASSQLCCPVQVNYNGKNYTTDFPLLNICSPDPLFFRLKKESTEEISFPLCLKIFRLGIKESDLLKHSAVILDSVWKKN